ncbi:MAG: cytochrome c oxidase subunit II [Acidimicrobiales bacterium]
MPSRPRPPRSRVARAGAAAVLASAALLAGGCSGPSFGQPDPVTDQGDSIRSLWSGSVIAALAVGAFVWGLIGWALIRYRRRSDALPSQNPLNVPIEILYTVVPIIIVAVLFAFTVRTEREVGEGAAGGPPDVVVDVVGFQWQWQFEYPAEGITVTGASAGEPPEMVLPVGQTIRFNLRAADVNHSFWVPRFLAKRDLIPGVRNSMTVDTNTLGAFVGRCAEFCGLDHWRMNFAVRVVEPAAYERWVAEQQAGGS